ncbi:hypothetical protein DMENIID0001_136370 [Sergentomyia squamirostris]
MSQFVSHENRNLGTENSVPLQEIAEPEEVLNEFKTEVLDVEDTESDSIELVYPANPPQIPVNNPISEIRNSGESSLMNRSVEIVPEINPVHVERKKTKRRQRKTLRNNRTSGEMETDKTSTDSEDSEDKAENSPKKKKKIDKMTFGPPPKDFYLPDIGKERSYSRTDMWSALMSVKNGMAVTNASKKYKIAKQTLHDYMKKYGIKSKLSRSKPALDLKQSQH